MLLRCSVAEPKDAPRIAEIHMAAFGTNAMLLAQFRSAEVRQALQHSIELKALADIEDSNTTVLTVRRSGTSTILDEKELSNALGVPSSEGAIVAFAKWVHPTEPNDGYEEPPWIWPDGTALDVLTNWTKLVEEAQTTAMGSQACYRLTFIATDPQYQRHGAGMLMVTWGLERCEKERLPAYLESTEEAVHLYKKTGFEAALDICMTITFESCKGDVVTQEYKELGMVYRPKSHFLRI